MAYFTYFHNNNISKDGDAIQGTCLSMCPQDEFKLRVREKMVHILEVVGNEKKLVKSYSRSAADSNMAVPRLLRPYHVLVETVKYLLSDVLTRTDISSPVVYDFVNNRLRAVRQDITIQRLSPKQSAILLEPMIRFYIFFEYKLFGVPLQYFDPVLNEKYLLECLKWFLSCCDYLDKDSKENIDELGEKLEGLSVKEFNDEGYDRAMMESVYILCNLNDIHPLYRYLNLSSHLKRHPMLKLSYKIALANMKGNFVQVVKLADGLCPLLRCAVYLQLPQLQRRAIEVLSHSYTSKTLSVPSSALREWLSVASDWEARDVCQHYGMTADGAAVRFDKTAFKRDVAMHQPKIQLLCNGRLNLDINYIFSYKCC